MQSKAKNTVTDISVHKEDQDQNIILVKADTSNRPEAAPV